MSQHFNKPDKSDKSDPTNKPNAHYWITGKNTVLQTLQTAPQRVQKVLIIKKPVGKDDRIEAIYNHIRDNGIPFQHVTKQQLEQKLSRIEGEDSTAHQGVAAQLAPKPLLNLYQLIEHAKAAIESGQKPLIIMLDKVTDPRNYGAILRVADACGALAVVTTKRNHPGFGPAVTKTACGAESTVPIAVIPNLVQGLESLQPLGFWSVGADSGDETTVYTKYKATTPTILVMGSEGAGLSRLTQKACDGCVHIPMRGQVDSLNVAAATAVLAFHLTEQLFSS